jgi:hypothetical protein
MTWLSELQKELGKDFQLVKAAKRASVKVRHPREVAYENIKNSLAFLKDPTFKVKKSGKEAKPDLCYQELSDGTVEVFVKYARSRLKLQGDEDAIRVPKAALETVLVKLGDGIRDGEFDDQLEARASQFRARLKGNSKGRKKKMN